KSTLFNLLVRREDRALTSSVPGTTRDALSEPAFFGGWPIRLFDTAGTRDLEGRAPEEAIEREGQALATKLRDRAELIFVLDPAGREGPAPVAEAKERILRSQADRVPGPLGDASISVHAAPKAAAALCQSLFLEAFRLPSAGWSPKTAAPFDARSCEAVERALGELETSKGEVDSRIERARAHLVASL
ncbi:MAG: GTPase, partial [Planctomycetota bacterium]